MTARQVRTFKVNFPLQHFHQSSLRKVDLINYYHSRVCLSVCVCVSVCLSVQAITFKPLHKATPVLVWRYILTISTSHFSVTVIGSRSRSHIEIRVILQGQGQIGITSRERYSYAGGFYLINCRHWISMRKVFTSQDVPLQKKWLRL